MSKQRELLEIANLEHDDILDVKKVMPYGWDGSNAIAIKVNSSGELIISEDSLIIGKEIRLSGSYIFIGVSKTSTDTSGATWKIKRLDTTNTLTTKWADGNQDYDNVFDNYLTISYS